jgi:hypothetical protein
MKTVDIRADYEVDSKAVKLTIIFGNAQIGRSVVTLEKAEKGRGDIEELVIGSGPKIRGKLLKTRSLVTDVNDMTNRTSVTYRLTGGKRSQDFTSSGTVDANQGSVTHRAQFRLV